MGLKGNTKRENTSVKEVDFYTVELLGFAVLPTAGILDQLIGTELRIQETMVCRRLAATEELRRAMKIQDTSQQTTPCRVTRLRRTRSQPSSERRSSLRRRRSFGGNGRRQHSTDNMAPNSQREAQTINRDSIQREITRRIRLTNQGQNHGSRDPEMVSDELARGEQRLQQGTSAVRGQNAAPGRNGHLEAHILQVAQASGVILRVLGDEFNDLYAGTGRSCRPPTPSHKR